MMNDSFNAHVHRANEASVGLAVGCSNLFE